MIGYQIYVGLNDGTTHTQLFDSEKYISILKNICKAYKVSFSFDCINGGYIYGDGTLSVENTLHVTIYDIDKGTIEEIGKDLCTFFHQECVMIIENEIERIYVKGDKAVHDEISLIRK